MGGVVIMGEGRVLTCWMGWLELLGRCRGMVGVLGRCMVGVGLVGL